MGEQHMSRKKSADPVGDTLRVFQSAYESLSTEQRRELEADLMEASWFGHTIKLDMGFLSAKATWLQKKNSHRSRVPSLEIRKRNDELLADRESETPPKSWERMKQDHGLPRETIRSAVKEAEHRRDLARAEELERARIRSVKEKVKAQIQAIFGK
jgi:hypothetical protein